MAENESLSFWNFQKIDTYDFIYIFLRVSLKAIFCDWSVSMFKKLDYCKLQSFQWWHASKMTHQKCLPTESKKQFTRIYGQ